MPRKKPAAPNGYGPGKRPPFKLPPNCTTLSASIMWDWAVVGEAGLPLMRAPNGSEPPGTPWKGPYIVKQHYPDLRPGEVNFIAF